VRHTVDAVPIELELLAHDPEHFPTAVLVHGGASVRPFQFHHLSSSGFGRGVRAAYTAHLNV
jgi:hypothetical protein